MSSTVASIQDIPKHKSRDSAVPRVASPASLNLLVPRLSAQLSNRSCSSGLSLPIDHCTRMRRVVHVTFDPPMCADGDFYSHPTSKASACTKNQPMDNRAPRKRNEPQKEKERRDGEQKADDVILTLTRCRGRRRRQETWP